MKIGICGIIKDEQSYLDEWIQYNLAMGYTDIHLYEDYDSTSHKDICDKYENVYLHSVGDYVSNKVLVRQNILNKEFARDNKYNLDWCAFIDVDEFIAFDEGYDMERLLSEFNNFNGIYLFWKTYGANGHIHKPDCGVVEAYTNDKPDLESHVNYSFKSFVHLSKSSQNIWPSNHEYKDLVKTDYRTFDRDRNHKIPVFDKAWLNHYFTKSWDEWVWKLNQRGDLIPGNRKILDFFKYNNDMESIKDELIKNI